jgi:hypothetical protein
MKSIANFVLMTLVLASVSAFSQTNFSSSLITSTHRYATTMYGGWGAHLGHTLRSTSNSLWFVDDTGNNVNVNAGLAYYEFVNGQWSKIASLAFPGTVEQNTGSLMSGNMIYTYGVDIANDRVVECYLNTATVTTRACNELSFNTGASSNYIGATISPSGTRVVWWTNTTGEFQYIYNFGGGWNGPVVSAMDGYADYSYVDARLASDNSHIYFLGNAAHVPGGGCGTCYDVLYGSTTLGTAISWRNLQTNGMAKETWLDPSGGVHFLLYSAASSALKYFYKPPGGAIANESALINITATSARISARIVQTTTSANLVVTYSDQALSYRAIALTDISGPINWSSLAENAVTPPAGLGNLTVYPESPMYQTTATPNLDFAIDGDLVQGSVYFMQSN